MKRNFYTKGFTIIELLLYMGVFTILLTVTMQMFGSVFNAQEESDATSSVSQDGRYILNRMSYDISQAQSLTSSSSSVLNFVVNGASNSYFLSGGNLEFTNGTNGFTDQLNSAQTSVSNLTFTKVGNTNGKPTVQVTFTLSSITVQISGKEVKTFQTTIGTR